MSEVKYMAQKLHGKALSSFSMEHFLEIEHKQLSLSLIGSAPPTWKSGVVKGAASLQTQHTSAGESRHTTKPPTFLFFFFSGIWWNTRWFISVSIYFDYRNTIWVFETVRSHVTSSRLGWLMLWSFIYELNLISSCRICCIPLVKTAE